MSNGRFRIIEKPKSEIEAICNGVLARLNTDRDLDSFDWSIIKGQLSTAMNTAKRAMHLANYGGDTNVR